MAENKPVIRLYFAKVKESFYDVSEEEKSAFMHKDRANLNELGMRVIMMIDCRWSNEEWDYIGIEERPTQDALVKRSKFEKNDPETFRYVESMTYLGTPESFAEYGNK